MNSVARGGFKVFLGVNATLSQWNQEETECSIIIDDNPLAEFVELPEKCNTLYKHIPFFKYCIYFINTFQTKKKKKKKRWYSNMLCGVIRGALEMVHMRVECNFVKDTLRGDDVTEIRVLFKEKVGEELVEGYAE